MKHTPEPWNLHPYYKGDPFTVTSDNEEPWTAAYLRISKGEKLIGEVSMSTVNNGGWPHITNTIEMRANAERIILCVNALAGLTEEQIKGINFSLLSASATI